MDERQPRTESFWSYALSFYAQPGVRDLCLRLQDGGGVDVMLLMALSWAAGPGRAPLSIAELQALQRHTADWRRRAVLPLRAVRVDLRAGVAGLDPAASEAFRDRVKQLELAAERVQAGMIADWLARRPGGGVAGDHREGLLWLTAAAAPSEAEVAALIAAANPA